MTPAPTNTQSLQSEPEMQRGIYVPVLTFFNKDAEESLDLNTYYKHVQHMAKSGCAGIVALGSTGERVSLSERERDQLIKTARKALDEAGFNKMPLIVGAGDHSVQGAIASIKSSYQAGATHALVLPSSYYPAQLGKQGIIDFYTKVSIASPIPIFIYSYPGVCSGIVIDSETVTKLSSLPNICGIKHTDHDIGKMSRHCALAAKGQKSFIVLGGASDYLIAALSVGAIGTITGMANIVPKTVVRIQNLWDKGEYEEARSLQHILSLAEWELGKGGIPIHKELTEYVRGYGGKARSPVQPSSKEVIQQAITGFAQLIELERKLEKVT
ncbi:hypothetical protein L7F22_042200 [Adiantum nelumboides]|nr:hypothetical protein [Adiantum nelumboides]